MSKTKAVYIKATELQKYVVEFITITPRDVIHSEPLVNYLPNVGDEIFLKKASYKVKIRRYNIDEKRVMVFIERNIN